MPLPSAPILQIELTLRTDSLITEAERLRIQADTGLNYLGNLGRVTSLLSVGKLEQVLRNSSPLQREDLIGEFSAALFVLGELQCGLAEFVFGVVDELHKLVPESKSK